MSAAAQSWGFQRYRTDRAGQAVHRAIELTKFLIKIDNTVACQGDGTT